jgi:phage-related protein
MASGTELQIIISAQIAEAEAALKSIGETAQQMGEVLASAGTEASGALNEMQGSALGADTAISALFDAATKATGAGESLAQSVLSVEGPLNEVANGADKARAALDSIAEATSPLQAVAENAEKAKASLAELGVGTDPINQLEAAAEKLAVELQQTADAAAEAANELTKAGAAAEEAAGEMLSLSGAVNETKEGIEATQIAMKAFMAVAMGGMLVEWTEGAEKMATSLQKLQAETGLSGDVVERLAIVANGAGISSDQLASMIGRLDMRVGNATIGTKSFADALDNLGINSQKFAESNLSEQASMIAEAIQKSNMPAKELDSTLKSLGINAKDLGSNMQSNLNVISAGLAQTSQNGSTLGRALAEAGISMQSFAGADVEEKIRMLGKYFEETQDKARATALVMQVFGKSGQDMLPLIENFAELDDYAKQLKMPVMDTHEIELAAEKTKMLQTALEMMLDSALVKILPVVDALGKAFYDLATNITHPGEAIKEFVKDLGPVGATVMGAVMAFEGMKVINSITGTLKAFGETARAAAVFTGLLEAAEGQATIKTVALSAATKTVTIAQAAFNAVMDTNPIALVVLGIAALIAGIVLLIAHWQKVSDATKKVWGELTGWLMGIWRDIENTASSIWNGIANVLSSVWNAIKTVAETFWNAEINGWKNIWNALVNAAKTIWDGLIKVFSNMWDTIKSAADAFWNAEITGWENIWNALIKTAKTIWDGLAKVFENLWDGIKAAAEAFWNAEVQGWKNIWTGLVNDAETIFNGLRTFFTNLWNEALQWGSNIVHMIAQGIQNAAHEVVAAAQSVANSIKSFLGFHSPTEEGPGSDADQWAPNLIAMYTQGLQAGIPKVRAILNTLLAPVSTALSGIGVNGTISQSITHSWPAAAIPAGFAGGAPTIIIQVSGNITRNEQELAQIVASEIQKKLKLRTQLS